MIIARFHRKGGEVILAACDSEIAGRRLADGEVTMDTGTDFFKGSEVSEDEFRGMLAQATSANLVGERAVGIAVKEGFVHPDACLDIAGVPFAMFFCMG